MMPSGAFPEWWCADSRFLPAVMPMSLVPLKLKHHHDERHQQAGPRAVGVAGHQAVRQEPSTVNQRWREAFANA